MDEEPDALGDIAARLNEYPDDGFTLIRLHFTTSIPIKKIVHLFAKYKENGRSGANSFGDYVVEFTFIVLYHK